MSITFPTVVVFLGVLQLALAALNVPGFARWNWLGGGLFTLAVAYCVSVRS